MFYAYVTKFVFLNPAYLFLTINTTILCMYVCMYNIVIHGHVYNFVCYHIYRLLDSTWWVSGSYANNSHCYMDLLQKKSKRKSPSWERW